MTEEATDQRPIGWLRGPTLIQVTAFFGNLSFDRAVWVVYLTTHGVSLVQVGALQALLSATIVIGNVPLGMVADRVGRRPVLLVGRAALMIYPLLMLLPHSSLALSGAFLLHGLGLTCVYGSEQSLLSEQQGGPGDSGAFATVLGRYFAILTVAPSVAAIIGGAIGEVSWPLVFGLTSVAQAVAILLVLQIQEAPRRPPVRTERRRTHVVARARQFLGDIRLAMPMLLGIALFSGSISSIFIVAQPMLYAGGLSTLIISIVYSGTEFIAAGVALVASHLSRIVGESRAVIGASVLTGISFLAYASADPWLLVLPLLVIAITDNVVDTLGQSRLTTRLPERSRATGLSVLHVLSYLVITGQVMLAGWIPGDQHVVVGAIEVCSLAAASVALWLASRRGVDEDRGPAASDVVAE